MHGIHHDIKPNAIMMLLFFLLIYAANRGLEDVSTLPLFVEQNELLTIVQTEKQ